MESKLEAPNNIVKKISLSDIVRAKGNVKPISEQNDGIVTKKDVKVKPKVDNETKLQLEYLKKIDDNIDRVKKEIYNDKLKDYIDEQKQIAEEKEFNGETELTSLADIAAYKAQHKNEKADTIIDATPVESVVEETPEEVDIKNEPVESTTPDFLDKPITKIDFDEDDFDDELIDDDKDSSDSELDDIAEDEKVELSEEDKDAKEKEDEEKEKLEYKLKSEAISKVISPEIIDLNGFTESGRTININTAINHIAETDSRFTESKSAVLFNTGKTISFTPLTGSEVVALSPNNFSSDLELFRKSFTTMYNHDVSPDKPRTFTAWAKSIDAGDLNQLYFGLYNATFGDANFIGYQCPKCESFFMKKFPVDSMWEFNKEATKEQKEKFNFIKEHGESEDNFKSKIKRYNLSKDYIIQLKPRSVYDMLELNYLDDKFRRKYESILRAMGCIDKVFFVDYTHKQIIPVDFKPDKESIIKTIKNKCKVLYKILTSITTDNYSLFMGVIQNYYIDEYKGLGLLKYFIPAVDCKETFKDGLNKGVICNNHIDKVETVPFEMLFTRHQLVMQSTLHVD